MHGQQNMKNSWRVLMTFVTVFRIFSSILCKSEKSVGPAVHYFKSNPLTLYLLTWKIWWVRNNGTKGQMGFNSAFKGLRKARKRNSTDLKPIIKLTDKILLVNTGCPTRYRTQHFFNNSNTNEGIATKFEQEYVRSVRNEVECGCSVCL